LSILIPALLVLCVTPTPTKKLYGETCTLLLFGPLYNHGSAMFMSLLFVCYEVGVWGYYWVWAGEWHSAGHYYFGGGGDFGTGDEYVTVWMRE
jgi:hypothetical protein